LTPAPVPTEDAGMRRLADCTWPAVERLAADPAAVVVLPLGAIEQHGPHLPLSVDWLGAEELARRIAPHLARAGWHALLAPSLPYGVSTLAEGWSGTVSLPTATFQRLVIDVVRALAGHGFRRFVLANYQADPDHLAAMGTVRRALERGGRLQVLFAGFAPEPAAAAAMTSPRVRRVLRSPRAEREWHSGELETAVVLSIDPRLVRQATARRLPPVWVDFRGALARGARNFRDLAPGGRGYFGWPAVARAATGRRAMALRARLIAGALVRALRAWPGPAVNAGRRRASRPRAAPAAAPSPPRRGTGRSPARRTPTASRPRRRSQGRARSRRS
jgi:creatinine amidohydrolase